MLEKLQLHELVEIFQQSSDPDFLQLLKRVRKGMERDNCMIQIQSQANTVSATQHGECVRAYLNSFLAGQEYEDSISKLDSEFLLIKARDINKDVEINRCSKSIPDNSGLSQNPNLPANCVSVQQ